MCKGENKYAQSRTSTRKEKESAKEQSAKALKSHPSDIFSGGTTHTPTYVYIKREKKKGPQPEVSIDYFFFFFLHFILFLFNPRNLSNAARLFSLFFFFIFLKFIVSRSFIYDHEFRVCRDLFSFFFFVKNAHSDSGKLEIWKEEKDIII